MNALIKNRVLLEEYLSKKGSIADNAKFDNNMTEDLSRQSRNHGSGGGRHCTIL
jgi:hypothetical protein